MTYRFDGKFHSSDKLTLRQHQQIATLVNAGMPHQALAQDYGVSIDTIHSIAHRRHRWFKENQIAKTEEDKFWYAQTTYRQRPLALTIKRYIERIVLQPVAERIAEAAAQSSPSERLLEDTVHYPPLTPQQLRKTATTVLYEDIRSGRLYRTQHDAMQRAAPVVRQRHEQSLSVHVRRQRKTLRGKLEYALEQLNPVHRHILKLHYGLTPQGAYTLEEIGAIYDRTRELMRRRKDEALDALRKELTQM